MKPATCPRLFEVEAMRDGRLAGTELASFERHVTSCPACSNEVRALEALAEPLRKNSRSTADELHARRERTRLLAAFNQELVAPERRFGPRRLLLVPAGLALLVAALFVFGRLRVPEPALRASGSVVVRGDSSARWSERTERDGKKLIVERGALWIHVDHPSREGRFIVVLPDGELEDTGTTFTVTVEDGRTTRVAVEEGSVLLRIRGQPPVALGAGGRWSVDARPSGSPAEGRRPLTGPSGSPAEGRRPLTGPSGSPAEGRRPLTGPSGSPAEGRRPLTGPSGSPAEGRRPLTGPSARASAPPAAPEPAHSAPPPSAPLRDPSLDFRAAMAALDAGKNLEAAAAFASFLAKHPRDTRAEDAAYLRIIALQRAGAQGAMKDAALAYLRRYPQGFRRAEAENLAR